MDPKFCNCSTCRKANPGQAGESSAQSVLGATGLRRQPTFLELVRDLEERPPWGAKSVPVPRRHALDMMRDPRIQQVMGALHETAQTFENNVQEHAAPRASMM